MAAAAGNHARSGFLLNDRISRLDSKESPVETREATPEDGLTSEELRSREAARLASLVLNIKQLNSEKAGKQPQNRTSEALHISSGTLSRVRMAKAKLELEYQMIRSFQEFDFAGLVKPEPDKAINLSEMHSAEEDRELRGTYNPLQTIRNRSQRPVTSPFGARNSSPAPQDSRRSGLATWKVDPAETVADFGWQQRNWQVMRNRFDKLVYQPERTSSHSPQGSLSRHEELISRIKTKLSSHVHRRDSSDSSFSESDMYSSTPQSPRSLSEDKTQVIDQRNRSISPVRKVNIESIQSRVAPQFEPLKDRRVSITAPVLQHPDISRLRREHLSLEPAQPESTAVEEPEPQEQDNAVDDGPAADSYSNAKEMKYLDMVFFLSHMHVLNGSISRNGSTADLLGDTKRQCDEASTSISTTASRAMSELVPRSRQVVHTQGSAIRALHDDLSQVKAPQMDRVLISSDKIIGEVSTTLNLEMRRVGERLDRVASDSPSVQWVRDLAYWMLEWVLVIVMWVMWAFVSAIRLFKSVFALALSSIRWLLWC